jgi:hypothetical protein
MNLKLLTLTWRLCKALKEEYKLGRARRVYNQKRKDYLRLHPLDPGILHEHAIQSGSCVRCGCSKEAIIYFNWHCRVR